MIDFRNKRIAGWMIIFTAVLAGSVLFLTGCGDRQLIVDDAHLETRAETESTVITAALAEAEGRADADAGNPGENEPEMLYVHVCGAVCNPGVYLLPAGSRCFEAIEQAGGLREDAESSFLNLAAPLSDGMQLRVPTVEEVLEGTAGEAGAGAVSSGPGSSADTGNAGRININTADAATLCTLPGIGETRAKQIVAYREANGAFRAPEDIMNVTGIKAGLYEQIKDLICV
jgi:competence protein ComEA